MKVQMTVGEAERIYHAHMRLKHFAEVAELVSDDLLFLIPAGGDEMHKINGDAVNVALANQSIIPRIKMHAVILLCAMNTVAILTMIAIEVWG